MLLGCGWKNYNFWYEPEYEVNTKCYGYEKSCNLEFYDEQNRKKVAFIPVTHWTLAFSYFLQGKLNSAVNLHIPVTHFLNLVLALFFKKNK